jgi:hypothetical protein
MQPLTDRFISSQFFSRVHMCVRLFYKCMDFIFNDSGYFYIRAPDADRDTALHSFLNGNSYFFGKGVDTLSFNLWKKNCGSYSSPQIKRLA